MPIVPPDFGLRNAARPTRAGRAGPGTEVTGMMAQKSVKKVVLAYSGGLDTSIILKWLQTTYQCEVVTFTADLGQGESSVRRATRRCSSASSPRTSSWTISVRNSSATTSFRCSAPMHSTRACTCGNVHRPPSHRQAADRDRPDGRCGRGVARRDRQGQRPGPVRAELLRAEPEHHDHRAVARMGPDVADAADRVRRAEPDPDRQGQARRCAFSVDANLLHASSEGKVLEDPAVEVPDYVYSRTIDPEKAPDTADCDHRRLREGRRRSPSMA